METTSQANSFMMQTAAELVTAPVSLATPCQTNPDAEKGIVYFPICSFTNCLGISTSTFINSLSFRVFQ